MGVPPTMEILVDEPLLGLGVEARELVLDFDFDLGAGWSDIKNPAC
jgi:hypothetical protein